MSGRYVWLKVSSIINTMTYNRVDLSHNGISCVQKCITSRYVLSIFFCNEGSDILRGWKVEIQDVCCTQMSLWVSLSLLVTHSQLTIQGGATWFHSLASRHNLHSFAVTRNLPVPSDGKSRRWLAVEVSVFRHVYTPPLTTCACLEPAHCDVFSISNSPFQGGRAPPVCSNSIFWKQ